MYPGELTTTDENMIGRSGEIKWQFGHRLKRNATYHKLLLNDNSISLRTEKDEKGDNNDDSQADLKSMILSLSIKDEDR